MATSYIRPQGLSSVVFEVSGNSAIDIQVSTYSEIIMFSCAAYSDASGYYGTARTTTADANIYVKTVNSTTGLSVARKTNTTDTITVTNSTAGVVYFLVLVLHGPVPTLAS